MQRISCNSAQMQLRQRTAVEASLEGSLSPNLQVEQYHSYHNGDGSNHNVRHGWMQEVDDVIDVGAHEVDDLAPLNRLLGPAGASTALSLRGLNRASCLRPVAGFKVHPLSTKPSADVHTALCVVRMKEGCTRSM